MTALPALAVEVELYDGTIIAAESYVVTGSFVYLTLPSGARVGYAMEDVKSITEEPEQATQDKDAAEAGGEEAAVGTKQEKGGAFGSAIADESAGKAAVAVTDEDVSHVRPSRRAGSEEEGEEAEGEKEGEEVEAASGSGSVSLQGLQVKKKGEGLFEVVGKVKNGMNVQVVDVRATLSISGSRHPVETSVAGTLAPGAEAPFSHTFRAAGTDSPRVSARLSWMQAKPSPDTGN